MEISKEIAKKYLFKNNTFSRRMNDDDSERFICEVGDSKQEDFKPQVKLMKWAEKDGIENECNFSVRLIGNEKFETITEDNKIKLIDNKRECHFYEIDKCEEHKEGGFEFEVLLKEKPKTNKVQMSIETKGLKFYYQPKLTQKEKDEGAFRPENVIGSYAVYHESKTGDYSKLGKKNYRAGKAFHIYRPKIIDNAGKEVWGKLNIDKDILTVEIPQEFLDKAVYPVIVDPTFGCTTAGSAYSTVTDNALYGGVFTSPSNTTTGNSFSFYAETIFDTENLKGVLVLKSNLNIVANGVGNAVSINATPSWNISTFGTLPGITPDTEYALAIIKSTGENVRFFFDDGASNQRYVDLTNNYATPVDPTDATNDYNYKYSIYCTYTEPIPATGLRTTNRFVQKPFPGVQLNHNHPLAKGLVGCWLMNERSGSRVADLSGKGNHGLINGAEWAGGGLDFINNNGDYVDAGNDVSLDFSADDKITIVAKIKPTAQTSFHRIVSCQYNGATTGASVFQLGIVSGEWRWSIGGAFDISPALPTSQNDVSKHFAGIYDASASRTEMYIDGSNIFTSDVYNAGIRDNLNSKPITIGAEYWTSAEYGFNGLIEYVYIYNRALSAEEIKQLHIDPYCMFQKRRPVSLYFVGAGGTAYEKIFSETFSLTEELKRVPNKVLLNTLSLAESFSRKPVKVFESNITNTDSIEKKGIKNFSESISITEAFSKIGTFIKSIAESLNITEAINKKPVKNLNSSITVTENISKTITIQKIISDTLTVADTIVRKAGKVLSEAITATENFVKIVVIQKVISETFSITEAIAKKTTKILSSAINIISGGTEMKSPTATGVVNPGWANLDNILTSDNQYAEGMVMG